MAEHHLNGTKVGSPFQKMACERMTDKMRINPLPDPSLLPIGLKIMPETLAAHPLPQAVKEEKTAFLPSRKCFTSCPEIKADPLHCLRSERDNPLFRSLS